MDPKTLDINSFIGQSLPPEILDQLRVLHRIKFPLKDTVPSAVSSSSIEGTTPDAAAQASVDDLINHVKDMESLVKQIEDYTDDLTADMSIPASSNLVSNAAKNLGSKDGTITKEVFDKAIAMFDYAPMFLIGQDPELAALTGDGSVDGPWLDCGQVTRSLANSFTIKIKDTAEASAVIKDQGMKIIEDFDNKQMNMFKEILNGTWWNLFWPKFVVDLVILGPIRRIAFPIDSLFVFFSKFPFRIPTKDQVAENGPINKLLKPLRDFLMCLPFKFYPRYRPPKGVSCPNSYKVPCPDSSKANTSTPKYKSFSDLKEGKGLVGDLLTDLNTCINVDDFIGKFSKEDPSGLGVSPECLKSAKIVLDAVLSDALTASPADGYDLVKQQLKAGVEKVFGG